MLTIGNTNNTPSPSNKNGLTRTNRYRGFKELQVNWFSVAGGLVHTLYKSRGLREPQPQFPHLSTKARKCMDKEVNYVKKLAVVKIFSYFCLFR